MSELNLYFDLQFETEGYPDVIFSLIFDKAVTDEALSQLEKSIGNAIASYNDSVSAPIHYASFVDDLIEHEENVALLHVDFGNAQPDALNMILKHFNDNIEGLICVAAM